jgi:hypothetical protein
MQLAQGRGHERALLNTAIYTPPGFLDHLSDYQFLKKYCAAGSTRRKWIVLMYSETTGRKITSVAYDFRSEIENKAEVTEAGVCDGTTWQKGECTCRMYENSKIYNDASKKYLTYRKTSYHS